jgi:nitrate reductase NapA
MTTSLERRQFLQLTALGAAVAAAQARAGMATPVDDGAPRTVDGVTWSKAPCRFCGTGCHVQVGVQGGRVVAIRGDRQADVNKGLLCVKGYHVALALHGKDRLTTPLLRKNGKLEPIRWDEAVDVIARRVLHDPKGFAVYGSGQWTIPEGYAASKFVKAGLGTHQIDPNARLCMASAVTGFMSTYGVDEPAGCYDDLDQCDTVVLWGNNPAEMHPVLWSRIVDRRARGQKVTIVDLTTRRTRSSQLADHVLVFKPQTDLAVANGVMAELLRRGTWDKAFCDKHLAWRKDTEKPGLEGQPMPLADFQKAMAPYTPEKVEQISGVPAADIRMLADLFGDRNKRIVSLWCMGVNQHTRGTAINRLVHGLHLLSGHFGRPGDAPTSLTGQPSACGTVREVGTLSHALPGGRAVMNEQHRKQVEEIWHLESGRIAPKPGYHTVAMWEKFCTPKDKGGDISTIWVQVTNPGQSLPNLLKLFDWSKAGDKFLIVSDVYPTATTRKADLVLPSAMWVEKNGMFGNSERRTQQWWKLVDPPGQARPDVWQTLAVAHRLLELGHAGMKDKDGQFLFAIKDKQGREVPTWEWAHFADVNVDEALFEEYRPFTVMKHKQLAPYQEYAKRRGLRWPVVQAQDGTWRETKRRFSEFDDPFVKKGEGVEFYHSPTKDGRAQVWFMPYTPPPEAPDAEYPLWLCTGRVLEHWHSGTMTMRIPQLRGAMPQAYVEVNPHDARRMGIGQGEVVVLQTRRGQLELPAWIGGRSQPPPGSVFVPFFDERLLINQLTLDAHDPISKQPDYKKCAARLVRKGQGAGA